MYYTLKKTPTHTSKDHLLNAIEISFLEEHFLLITETGERLKGIDAMQFWCARQKLPFEKTVTEFINTKKNTCNIFYLMA
ncbi:MAG: hypothetical protein ACR2KX_12205 [Chitinophagaceae bacterium]